MNFDLFKIHHKKIKGAAIVLFLLGTLDPMEGSILIAFASVILAGLYYIQQSPARKLFLIASAFIVTGVFFLFFLSSLGGFGEAAPLSKWWGLTILPYPIGWLGILVLLWRYRSSK